MHGITVLQVSIKPIRSNEIKAKWMVSQSRHLAHCRLRSRKPSSSCWHPLSAQSMSHPTGQFSHGFLGECNQESTVQVGGHASGNLLTKTAARCGSISKSLSIRDPASHEPHECNQPTNQQRTNQQTNQCLHAVIHTFSCTRCSRLCLRGWY